MNSSKKITTLIVKLIRETKEGIIIWSPKDISVQLAGGAELVDKIYTTIYKDKYFRLFKYRNRHYTDENVYGWDENIRLEVSDLDFKPEWAFPEEQAVYDLYDTVRFQVAGVSQLLNDILDEDDYDFANSYGAKDH